MEINLNLNKEKFTCKTKLIVKQTSLHYIPKYNKGYEVISLSNKKKYCTLKGREIKVYKSLHYSEIKVGGSNMDLIKSYKLNHFNYFKIFISDFVFFL
ncbi:protein of unknown function [Tenacibaculum soleae]